MPFENFEVKPVEEALNEHFSGQNLPLPAAALANYLAAVRSDSMTAVIETDYIDVDYSASYHEQLGRSFTPIRRETTRIHFFGEQLTKRRLINASDSTLRTMKSSYMGFTVVRPDWPTTLGRTFLKCPSLLGERSARFPTRDTTPVDLAGIPLSIESCPYMSQDQKVMACATAALWMASTPLAEKIPEIAWHSTTEITRMAMSLNRPFGPVVGRRGLHDQEMEQALLEIGFDPSLHIYPQPEDLVDICHLYVDSGIPPVLVVHTNGVGHAVTVVGYTLKPPVALNQASDGIIPAHQFISELVIHDDQRGMYLPVEVTNSPQGTPPPYATDLLVQMNGGYHHLSCDAILVPLPTRVMLDEYAVKIQTRVWITHAKEQGWIEDREVVTRTILIRSNTFKQTLLDLRDRGPTHGYPNFFVRFARGLPMPRYIWLVEVSYSDNLDPSDPESPPVIADLILDSTSTETLRPAFLLLHFPGVTLGNEAENGTMYSVYDIGPDDHPHPPFPDIPRP